MPGMSNEPRVYVLRINCVSYARRGPRTSGGYPPRAHQRSSAALFTKAEAEQAAHEWRDVDIQRGVHPDNYTLVEILKAHTDV